MDPSARPKTNEGKEEKLYKKSPLKTKALANQGFDVGKGKGRVKLEEFSWLVKLFLYLNGPDPTVIR